MGLMDRDYMKERRHEDAPPRSSTPPRAARTLPRLPRTSGPPDLPTWASVIVAAVLIILVTAFLGPIRLP